MYFTRRGIGGGVVSVMHTPWDPDPAKRYKLMNFESDGHWASWSSNGINIVDAPHNPVFTGGGDVGQFCWDPHTQQYLGYVKNAWFDTNGLQRRAVALTTTTNIEVWPKESLILWPDAFDDRWTPTNSIQRTHFYGLSAFPYETMYIGFLWIFRATNMAQGNPGYLIGPVFSELVSSHDGVHWTREEGDRPPILPVGADGTWDNGMVYTARAPVVDGDTIKVWYGGFDQPHDFNYSITTGAIGLATLRKDGFASLDAGGNSGTVLTKSLAAVGGALLVNYMANTGGSLKVEVLDTNANVLPGYSEADCVTLTGNSITQAVTWTAHSELPVDLPLVRLRFILQNASLYSFMAGESAGLPQAPAFTQQASNRTNYIGSTAAFIVKANGVPLPNYQWQKDGVNLSDGGHYSGCATATLTITGADTGDVATYSCLVTNISGSVTSSPVTLTVTGATCFAISNADFENGFTVAGGGYLANGWTEWEGYPGVTIGYDETAITHGGGNSQRIRVWGTNETSGGIYQRLPITPGQPFDISIWMYVADPLSACSLGVDPTGGTNASGGVTWSSASTNTSWVQETVSGTATADYITVFLKVASADANKRNGYFDDASPGIPTEPPQLMAQRSLEGAGLTLTWAECPNARLEQAAGLSMPMTWTTVTNQPSLGGGQKSVTPPPTETTAFFRLVPE